MKESQDYAESLRSYATTATKLTRSVAPKSDLVETPLSP